MDYSRSNVRRLSKSSYDPRKAAYDRHLKMATLGFDKLKQKRAELLAIQAKHKVKAAVDVVQPNTDESAKVDIEEKEKLREGEKEAERPDSENLRSRWNKLAMTMLSQKTRDQLAPVESPETLNSTLRRNSECAEEKNSLSPRLFELVSRISQSRSDATRVSANRAPKKRSQILEQSLQYGQHRREIAATYDTYSTLKDCRYLRLRSSDHSERNPFDINEIFDKKK
ncbi:hypothetical protein ACHWQZ_G008947 [Mnemiopsis leidyi]